MPAAVFLRQRRLEVSSVEDVWEVDEEWWRPEPISRVYYRVTTEDDRDITLFRDQIGGRWFRQNG